MADRDRPDSSPRPPIPSMWDGGDAPAAPWPPEAPVHAYGHPTDGGRGPGTRPRPTDPRRSRRGRLLAAGAAVLLLGLGGAAVAERVSDGSDGGGPQPSSASALERFDPRSAQPPLTSTSRPLPLGRAVVVGETAQDTELSAQTRRDATLTPSVRLRQATSANGRSTLGRYLLIDVTVTPSGGATALSTFDFELMLPNGLALQEASIESGYDQLWPDRLDEAWSGPVTATLVFELPDEPVLLVYGGFREQLASWAVPVQDVPVVTPAQVLGS